MTVTNIKDKEQSLITDIIGLIVSHLHPEKIILFGSRASGKKKKYSDFDIAIQGVEIGVREERLLKEALDEKLGIFSLDLINLDKVDSEFREIVIEKGKVIYEH